LPYAQRKVSTGYYFPAMNFDLTLLRKATRELGALRSVSGLLGWDQETFMPAKGGDVRAESQAVLSALLHERQTSEAWWNLIGDASAQTLTPRDAALVRELRRDAEMARKIPTDLAEDLARTASLAQQAWAKARAANGGKGAPVDFLPWLRKMVDLKRREADYLGYADVPYDALLDQFEPGARVATVKPVLEKLRDGLVPLLDRVLAQKAVTARIPEGSVPQSLQHAFNERLLRDMGFDLEAGRLDASAHPFTQGMAPYDVRLTTRYREDDWLNAVFSTLHEGGHGLYEQGLPTEEWGTPLGEAVSLAIHESQSRFWENRVGRSRPYWEHALPIAKEMLGGLVSGETVDSVLSRVNAVSRSFIRVEADELTYNLHVLLRFQLEEALFSGALEVDGLESAWSESMTKLLGVTPPDAARGFMQDVHWSCGLFGYFPTYTLGNLYAAQFAAAMEKELGSLDKMIRAGDFARMREWLREKIHKHGREFPAAELCRRATGEDLDAGYFLRYLEGKYL
jgi:carboxypeptidase Taq